MVKNVQEHGRILASLKETCAGKISRAVSGCRNFQSKAGEGLGCAVSSAVVNRSPEHRRDRTVLPQEQGRKQEMPEDKCQFLRTLKSHIHLCSLHSYCLQKFKDWVLEACTVTRALHFFVYILLIINDQATSILIEIKIISVTADNSAAFYDTDEIFSININSIGRALNFML